MLSKRVEELRALKSLQEQSREFFIMSCEEKLKQKRQLLPRLQETVQKDVVAPDEFQKVCQEKLQATIYHKINRCNMLQHQVRQRSQALDRLQRQLRQLQDTERQANWVQMQELRQLGSKIDKVTMKAGAGRRLTALYLRVRDALKQELVHLHSHLDLLSEIAKLYEQQHKDLKVLASEAIEVADVTKRDLASMGKKFLEEREMQHSSLAAQKASMDTYRLWLKKARDKRAQAGSHMIKAFNDDMDSDEWSGMSEDDSQEVTQKDSDRLTENIKKIETILQSSCLWDIPRLLLAQKKSSEYLQQHVKELKEEEQELKEALKEQELKHDKIKFREPCNTNRKTEENLRTRLQVEEARLEQMRTEVLKKEDLLLQFEMRINAIFARLRGITVPNQDDAVETMGLEEKLRHCKRKLRYLVQLVADMTPGSPTPSEDDSTFVEVRQWLETTTTNDAENLKVSFSDIDRSDYDALDLFEKDHVPTREFIKMQGMKLIEKMKSSKKKS